MKQAERIALTMEFLAELSDSELQAATVWKVMFAFNLLRENIAEELLIGEQLRRNLVSLNELRPELRRKMVNLEKTSLHALASGPIMDPANIYLPAGKLSIEETREREAQQVRKA